MLSFDITRNTGRFLNGIFRRMNAPKTRRTKPITIRIAYELFEELQRDSATNSWYVNDEINYRLRSKTLTQKIDKLESDIAELKAMVRALAEK